MKVGGMILELNCNIKTGVVEPSCMLTNQMSIIDEKLLGVLHF